MDFNRRTRERAIASEIAHELHRALGAIRPEELVGENRDVVEKVFGTAFDRHGVTAEAVAARILKFVPKRLAELNLKFADFNRQLDAAIRHRQPASSLVPGIRAE
jgi:hypothetical protein